MRMRSIAIAAAAAGLMHLAGAQAQQAGVAALERAFVRTVAKVRPSVITIGIPYQEPGAKSVGRAMLSGVAIEPEGHVVSLSNLLSGCQEVEVTLGSGESVTARVVGYDPVYGLGVLKVEGTRLPALAVADESSLAPGSWVLMVGNAFGLSHSVSWGIVSGVRPGVQVLGRPPNDMIQMTAPVNPGDSGCAVVNLRGELVGLASSSYTGSSAGAGISFAMPMTALRDSIEQIAAKGYVARGWLGVDIANVYLPHLDRQAVEVVDVAPNSPGHHAGLRSGDVILSLDGAPIRDSAAMVGRVLLAPPNRAVELEVVRLGRPMQVQAQLGQWRPVAAKPVRKAEGLVHHPFGAAGVRLSGAGSGPSSAELRRRLTELHEQLLQLLRENQR